MNTASHISTIAALITFSWGLLGVLTPPTAGVPSRWAALCLTGFSFVLLALAIDLDASVQDEQSAFPVVLLLWFLFSSSIILVRITFAAERVRRGSHVDGPNYLTTLATRWGEFSKQSAARAEERKQQRLREADERKQRRLREAEERKQQRLREAEERKGAEAVMAKIRAKIAAEEALGVDGRLEEQFGALQANAIDLAQYRDAIVEERRKVSAQRKDLREDRNFLDPNEYEDAKEQLDEDMEAVRWRLEWAESKLLETPTSDDGIAPSGKWARFEYIDRDGVVTAREITRWHRTDSHVVGYDRNRRAERTFRRDCISEWAAG